MSIPDYQSCMLPLLKFYSDGQDHTFREAIDALTLHFKLTEQEQKEMLPSGQQEIFDNRIGWARTYMKKAAFNRVTEARGAQDHGTRTGCSVRRGRKIGVNYWRNSRSSRTSVHSEHSDREAEAPETVPRQQNAGGSTWRPPTRRSRRPCRELLQRLKTCSPAFFERLVVEVIVKMGYGGSRQDAGRAIGKSGDGGIDGIIKEDKLGLDAIYIQAKRWENTVGGRRFRSLWCTNGAARQEGPLHHDVGFSAEAQDYVRGSTPRSC